MKSLSQQAERILNSPFSHAGREEPAKVEQPAGLNMAEARRRYSGAPPIGQTPMRIR